MAYHVGTFNVTKCIAFDLGNGFLSYWKASSQNHPKEDVVLWSISLCECMFNHPKLDRCLTNWAKKKINPQTKLAVYPLINFDNLWETRKAISIRDICPVSLIPSVFQQAVSAIQAHMVIYNSRDSTPKINCYVANIYISENEKGRGGGRQLYLLLLAFKSNFCFSVYAEIFVSFPNDSLLVYFINYGWEGGLCRQWAYYDLAQAVWQMHAVEPLCVVCLDRDCRKCFGSRFE